MAGIPPHAKKVFQGVIFDVYHWEQRLFDGSVATFERLRRPDSVSVIATKDGKILLLEQSQPSLRTFISFPGGRVEPGEEPLDAAKRELLEETGLASDDWELVVMLEPSSKIDMRSWLFVARGCVPSATSKPDAGECMSVKKVDFSGLLAAVASDSFRGADHALLLLRLFYRGELEKVQKVIFP